MQLYLKITHQYANPENLGGGNPHILATAL